MMMGFMWTPTFPSQYLFVLQQEVQKLSTHKMKEQSESNSPLTKIIPALSKICTRLSSCLPETDQIQITNNLQQIVIGLTHVVEKVVVSMGSYEKIIQGLEDNLRKHIKNQIELKLYYEHLEEIIAGLKKENLNSLETISSLKAELTILREKEKYFMTLSNANTRHNEETVMESKLDTITKIKNRLSLNGTQQFYTNYFVKKFEKDTETKELREKRESLANALKELYESPVEHKTDILKPKQVAKSKSKDSKQSKQRATSKINKSKGKCSPIMSSTVSLTRSSLKPTDRSNKQKSSEKEGRQKQEKQDHKQKKTKTKKAQKDKPTSSNASSRRSSKA